VTSAKDAQAARKGRAAEALIAATCVLASAGELNALTALVDDEGVDVGFKRRDGSRTLDVQIKARFSDDAGSAILRERGQFVANVGRNTFRPRPDLAMLFVAIDAAQARIDCAWLVPSTDLEQLGLAVAGGGNPRLRFAASAKPGSQDQWHAYRCAGTQLPAAILQAVTELEVTD